MSISSNSLKNISNLSAELIAEINAESKSVTIAADTEILRAGQFVKVIPIVLNGLIKVYTRHEDRELLLYYIKPNESCVMSFAAGIKNEPSRVFAQTEEETTALLMPVDKIAKWTQQFPDLNTLFFQQYNLRYSDLLDTIHHVLFDKIDKRLFDYLHEKARVTGSNPIKISHRQIANELGTVREVVSRVMKKLEHEGKLKQHANNIEILEW